MIKPPLRILIVDDEPNRSTGWADKIRSFLGDVDISALALEEAKAIMASADQRRREARLTPIGKNPLSKDAPECVLDGVDILIVDYDLQELLEVGQWSTGLQVATLARAFSTVRTIILVNQFGTNTFDLTLTKTYESNSDYDVGSDQLLNPALWDGKNADGYAPWSWCDGLLRSCHRFEQVVAWMLSNLDRPVLDSLGLIAEASESEAYNYIPRELWEKCVSDPGRTFREMVAEFEILTEKDRAAIAKFEEPCSRVAASVILHWLDRWLIPAGDVLVDLPHLVGAYPWLLADCRSDECWRGTTSLDNGFDAVNPKIRRHEFNPGFPLSRPTLWRRAVVSDAELREPREFTFDEVPDLVFCEDISKFQKFKDARPFPSKLPGADPLRYVSDPAKATGVEKWSTESVGYEPSVYFAL